MCVHVFIGPWECMSVETCESPICSRIESRIESGWWLGSNSESNQRTGRIPVLEIHVQRRVTVTNSFWIFL